MAGSWEPAKSLEQVHAASEEIAGVLCPGEALEAVRRLQSLPVVVRLSGCPDTAAAVSPQHVAEVESVADDMLARLDELSATLRTVGR